MNLNAVTDKKYILTMQIQWRQEIGEFWEEVEGFFLPFMPSCVVDIPLIYFLDASQIVPIRTGVQVNLPFEGDRLLLVQREKQRDVSI